MLIIENFFILPLSLINEEIVTLSDHLTFRKECSSAEIIIPLTDYYNCIGISRAWTHEVKVEAIYQMNVTFSIECNLYNTYQSILPKTLLVYLKIL